MTNSEVKASVILSVEVVLMREGGHGYNTVLARLRSQYDYELSDCYENPEPLRVILTQVYGEETKNIIDAIEAELTEYLEEHNVQEFLRILKNKK